MQVQARPELPHKDPLKGLGVAMSAVMHLALLMLGVLATQHWNDQALMPVRPLQAYLVYEQPQQEARPARSTEQVKPLAPPPLKTPTPHSQPAQAKVKPAPPTARPSPPTPEVRESAEVPQTAPEPTKQTPQDPVPAARPVVNTAPKVNAQYAASNPKPIYPAIARRLGQQGTVELRVLVSEQGSASKVEVTKSSGYGNLDAAAVEAISKWKFEPATQNGKPVSQWLTTKWAYELQN